MRNDLLNEDSLYFNFHKDSFLKTGDEFVWHLLLIIGTNTIVNIAPTLTDM